MAPVQGNPLRIAIRLSSNLSAQTLLAAVGRADDLGIERCWLSDNPYERSALITIAAASQTVRQMSLGAGVVSARARHPVVLAQDAAAVASYCLTPFTLGIGAGVESHRSELGLPAENNIELLSSRLGYLRKLLAGEQVSIGDGDARPVTLATAPEDVSIYLGGHGPRLLELASQMADGVIFSIGGTVRYLSAAVAVTQQAAPTRELTLRPLDHVAYVLFGGFGERADLAVGLRPVMTYYLRARGRNRHTLGMFGESAGGSTIHELVKRMDAGESLHHVISEDVIDEVAVWGNVPDALTRLMELRDAGVTEVALAIGDWCGGIDAAIDQVAILAKAWNEIDG